MVLPSVYDFRHEFLRLDKLHVQLMTWWRYINIKAI